MERECANFYPSADHRGPKTRPQREHTKDRSLIVLDIAGEPIAHGVGVLTVM
jgi:hypothetical protein